MSAATGAEVRFPRGSCSRRPRRSGLSRGARREVPRTPKRAGCRSRAPARASRTRHPGRGRRRRRGARPRARPRRRASRSRSRRRERALRRGPRRAAEPHREARGFVRAGPEGADGGKEEPANAGRRNGGEIPLMRIEEIGVHEHGFPQGGRLGDPIAGNFFEGGQAVGSEHGERRQRDRSVGGVHPDQQAAIRSGGGRERQSSQPF